MEGFRAVGGERPRSAPGSPMTPTSSEQPPATLLRPNHQTARRTGQRQRLRAVSYPSPSPTADHVRASEHAAEQAVSALTVSTADAADSGTRGSKRWDGPLDKVLGI